MKRLRHLAYAATALVAPLLLTVTTPAVVSAAYVESGLIQGSGGIYPGLGNFPDPQAISFSGTATVVGVNGTAPEVAMVYGCGFGGTLTGSLAGGAGTLSGSCGPISFQTCVLVYVALHMEIACNNSGENTGGGFLTCLLRPHQVLPTTSYDFTCPFQRRAPDRDVRHDRASPEQ